LGTSSYISSCIGKEFAIVSQQLFQRKDETLSVYDCGNLRAEKQKKTKEMENQCSTETAKAMFMLPNMVVCYKHICGMV